MRIRLLSIAAVAALYAMPTLAHVTIEQPQATASSTAKVTFRVPHGCAGAPMTTFKVRIPDGVTNVKPQPKAGWQLSTVKAKLDKPLAGDHGASITEVVREVIWSGGRLLDEHYDEFTLRGAMPAATGPLYFPAVQECEKGVERWIEIPDAGKASDDYKMPAPRLLIVPRN